MKAHLLPVLAGLAILAGPQGSPRSQGPAPLCAPDLVVHEWGTFTSVQGSDAVTLEGIAHDEEALPDFVWSRSREGGWRQYQMKMETPVTYFYAPRAMDLRVAVAFPAGLLTQWFPDVMKVEPPLPEGRQKKGEPAPSNVARSAPILPQGGLLDWGSVHVLAPDDERASLCMFPADERKLTWSFARKTDSNLLRAQNGEVEKFLFYRGLGKFEAPLQVHGELDGHVRLRTAARHGARQVLLLHVAGGMAGFTFAGDLGAGVEQDATFPAALRPLDAVVPEMGRLLEQSLVASGLYPKEAAAMVLTWSRQYFRTAGRRILYLLDQELTDAVIPLRIEPRPRTTVRVMVARVECIEPELEARISGLAHALASGNEQQRASAQHELLSFGRFTETYLRRAAALVKDEPQVRRGVEQLLAEVAPLR